MISDITVVIPFYNSCHERFKNLECILKSLYTNNIKTILCEQLHSDVESDVKRLADNYSNTTYIPFIKSGLVNKSKMVNIGVAKCKTTYIWQLDADVILKWLEIISNITTQDVIKPFDFVIRLSKQESNWYMANGSIKFLKGDAKNTTSRFGPLSFIIKKEIYEREQGMNEEFEGWSWEDIEFAKRIQKKYTIETIKSHGIHLWHPDATSNEENNVKIMNKLEKNQDTSMIETYMDAKNTIPQNIRSQNVYISTDKKEINGKISLGNKLSVIIPVRIDTTDRSHNLDIVLNYFSTFFTDFELIVVEHDTNEKVRKLVEEKGFTYIFRSNAGSFHKTWNFNFGVSISRNQFILAYDCDAIFNPNAIKDALDRLVDNKVKFIYPYNTYMVEIKKHVFDNINNFDGTFISNLPLVTHTQKTFDPNTYQILYGDISWDCTGGAFMFDKKEFFISGGYNHNIISYGCEDNEINVRVVNLGYTIERLRDYNCYHLEHGRATDSHYNNFFKSNEAEFQKVKNMKSADLWNYVQNGFKHTVFDTKKVLKLENNEHRFSISFDTPENKYDLSDLDIVIPIFSDSDDRIRNLEAVLTYIEKFFINYKIYLVELESNRCKQFYHRVGTEYINGSEKYNKTRAINIGIDKGSRKYISVWDVDAILTPSGIISAMEAIRSNTYHIAYPYNGWFIDVDGESLHSLIKTFDFTNVPLFPPANANRKDFTIRFSTRINLGGGGNNGGCVLFNRETLVSLGKYNENFWQWGFEDDEIEARFENMGYARFNAKDANCYHLAHQRSPEENGMGEDYKTVNEKEYRKVLAMNKEALTCYITSGFMSMVETISLVYTNDQSKEFVEKLLAVPQIKDIFIPSDVGIHHGKIKVYNKVDNTYRNKSIYPFMIGQIVARDLDDVEDIPYITNTLSSSRRCIIEKNGSIYAYRKEYNNIVSTGNIVSFVSKHIAKAGTKKCSILLTIYGKDTLRTQEWMDRFTTWKTKDYQIIAVVHNESLLHRAYLEWCKNKGYIDNLIYAESKHGHIRGLALASKYVESDIVFVINNDMLVSKESIDWCIDNVKHPSVGAIGWHYDISEHRGTFWRDGKLDYKLRPSMSENLTDKELNKLKLAKWFTGKVFDSIGDQKRLLLPNGSFICTKKSVWDSVGGFCFNQKDYFFHDDWFSYGVLESGLNVINLPAWGDSSKPDIFLAKTDYVWKGIEDKSKLIDDIKMHDNIEDTILNLVCENKSVCVLGEEPKLLKTVSYKPVKFIDEKCDVIIVNDYVSSMELLNKYLNDNGVVIFDSNFLNTFVETTSADETIDVKGKIGIIYKNVKRESYSTIENNISGKKISDEKNGSIKFTSKNITRQKFIVLTQPRCGYNNLQLMLCNHPQINADLNIFEKNRTRISEVLEEHRTSRPDVFLNSYFDLIMSENAKKCIGFRFNVWDEPGSVPMKLVDDSYKIIMLRRRNMTAGMIDCAWAHKTGKWHPTKTETNFEPFTVDMGWADGFITGMDEKYNSWKNFYDDNDRKYLEVFYEDLFNTDVEMKKILSYLGADTKVKLWTIFKKSTSDSVYENITNRDEINKKYGDKYGII